MTLVVAGVAAGFGLIAAAQADPAQAESLPPGGLGGGFIDGAGNPNANASDRAGQDGSGGGGGGQSDCSWDVWIEDDFAWHVYETEGVPSYSQTGRWLQRTCPRPAANGVVAQDVAILPEGGLVDPLDLALQALEAVEVPSPGIGMSPPSGRLYVHVPTWLWVDGSWWAPYEATARAGRVTSTVRAEPVTATWSTGDGSTVTCTGPGVAWAPGMSEDATDCAHTYTTASAVGPEGRFDLGVTVELAVSWESNTGQSGALSSISRTATQAVEVGEVQAIETE